MKFIRFLEQILPIVFLGLITFGFDSVSIAVLTIISATIHECGHIAALSSLSDCKASLPRGRIFGFYILPKRQLSYTEEIFVVLAGPLLNLFFGIIFLLVPDTAFGLYLHTFGIINIMTALSNLLPIENYDGYRATLAFFRMKSQYYEEAENILRSVSFLITLTFTFTSLYFIMKIGEGYWIFMVFFYSLISKITRKR